jgi:hypothetical protein
MRMGDSEGIKVRRRSFFNAPASGALIAAASTVPLTSTAVADTQTYDENESPAIGKPTRSRPSIR